MAASCAIVGGGPAGMMLGLLLARAGIKVDVLEKHADFLRDFRGDTIHPSTLELMHELGLLERFLQRPHQQAREIAAHVGERRFVVADFTHLPTKCQFLAFMPQWDFLDFVAREASRYPNFRLRMNTEATGVEQRDGRVSGVTVSSDEGSETVAADLVIAADGRASTVRSAAGMEVHALGAPMDVLWFRLSRKPDDPAETMGRFSAGRLFIAINRDDYWQCGYVIAKGTYERIRAEGLEAFRSRVKSVAPFVGDRVQELDAWDAVNLLTVRVDRLVRWYRAGLLCIGDAAHAMSPVGGVGINLAIQDAVAAANLLSEPLSRGHVDVADLRRVQRRRELPTRLTQWIQIQVQTRVIGPTLREDEALEAPLAIRLLDRFPILRRVPAYAIGVGVRPEHVRSPPGAP